MQQPRELDPRGVLSSSDSDASVGAELLNEDGEITSIDNDAQAAMDEMRIPTQEEDDRHGEQASPNGTGLTSIQRIQQVNGGDSLASNTSERNQWPS